MSKFRRGRSHGLDAQCLERPLQRSSKKTPVSTTVKSWRVERTGIQHKDTQLSNLHPLGRMKMRARNPGRRRSPLERCSRQDSKDVIVPFTRLNVPERVFEESVRVLRGRSKL
jgi:hypothetical protein